MTLGDELILIISSFKCKDFKAAKVASIKLKRSRKEEIGP